MLAVIKTGGKQYKVKEGDTLRVEKIDGEKGDKVTFDNILLLADDKEVKIGAPLVDNAKVEAEIVEQGLGKKIYVVKYKPKIRYHKKTGHRQPCTKIKIIKIG
ncbi:MAG: 50S ribosomal protein L21 [Patescibacteria group bacterium]